MLQSLPLVAASDESLKPLVLLLFFGVGAIFLGMGIYGIATKTVILRARDRWILARMGWEELGPRTALFTGGVHCLVGVLCMVVSIAIAVGFSLDEPAPTAPIAVPSSAPDEPPAADDFRSRRVQEMADAMLRGLDDAMEKQNPSSDVAPASDK